MFDSEYRPGDNLYTNSTLAIDADTGKIIWYFQLEMNEPETPDGAHYREIAVKLLGPIVLENKKAPEEGDGILRPSVGKA